MLKNHEQFWDDCATIIKEQVPAQSFKTWFEPIKSVSYQDKVLTIQVPNTFFYDWLEEHFVSELKFALNKVLGAGARLEYKILVDNHRKLSSTIPNKPTEQFASEKITY